MHKTSQAIRSKIVNDVLNVVSAAVVSASPDLQFKLDIDDNDDTLFDDVDGIQMFIKDADDKGDNSNSLCPTA